MLAKALQQAAGGTEKLYVDDVFSTWLYDGNGSTQTITNGIDLAGKGGMVWIKARSIANTHYLVDTTRGNTLYLQTSSTAAETFNSNGVQSFLSDGWSTSSLSSTNSTSQIYASWTFRNAPKFFTHTTKSHTTGTASTVDLSSLGTVGMVILKRIDTGSNWFVWHRSLGDGTCINLNSTATSYSDSLFTFSGGTTLTIASATGSGTYVIYAWAHDVSAEGMVQCGSFTTDGSGNATVNLGWEPQFVLTKVTDQAGDWLISDSLRGMSTPWSVPQGAAYVLKPNVTNAEVDPFTGAQGGAGPTPTGFDFKQITAVRTFVYLAIRIPNKPPTSGTEVFQPVVYTGTNTDNRLIDLGIKTDMVLLKERNDITGLTVGDRLRGAGRLTTAGTAAESIDADTLDQQLISTVEYGTAFSSMTGVWVGNDLSYKVNIDTTPDNHIAYAFQRRPGFFDIVCYTGTGVARTVPHQLGVAPELMIVKERSTAGDWPVYFSQNPDAYLRFNSTVAYVTSNIWDNTAATSSVFSLSSSALANTSGVTLVAYLFASLPGISKVGSYTGNGTSQTIDCGFSAGARFVLIKRTDSTGDWRVWDTARGIIAGNDPYLTTNTTAAEVTTNDSIDPDNSGFVVEQNATTNINVDTANYIYLAIA